MYRSFTSVFLISLLFYPFRHFSEIGGCWNSIAPLILIVALLVLFCFAYKKQSGYVVEHVKFTLGSNDEAETQKSKSSEKEGDGMV